MVNSEINHNLNAFLISFDRIEALCWFGEWWRSQEPERSFAVSFFRHLVKDQRNGSKMR